MSAKETGTAVRSLVIHEPMIIIRPAPSATLDYQTDLTAYSYPEGVLVNSPTRVAGVAIRNEAESTSVPLSIIF
jgi:hypothetical protein